MPGTQDQQTSQAQQPSYTGESIIRHYLVILHYMITFSLFAFLIFIVSTFATIKLSQDYLPEAGTILTI